jgi:hypothetical protein
LLATEEWTAIATIATGAAVSIFAVYLGFRFQRRALREDRMTELATLAIADLSNLLALTLGRIDLNEYRRVMDRWDESTSPEDVAIGGALLRAVTAYTGTSPPGESIVAPGRKLNLAQARAMLVHAEWGVDRGLSDLHRRILIDARTFDLLRPDLGIGKKMTHLVESARKESFGTTDSHSLDEKLAPLFGQFIDELRGIVS